MADLWQTVVTIGGTAGVIYVGYVINHVLQNRRDAQKEEAEKHRETRDAMRRYRENVTLPIRKGLDNVHAMLAARELYDTIADAGHKGGRLTPESEAQIEIIRQAMTTKTARDIVAITTEVMPLAGAITDEDTKKAVQKAILMPLLTESLRRNLSITDSDVEELVTKAYLALENYVTLAD